MCAFLQMSVNAQVLCELLHTGTTLRTIFGLCVHVKTVTEQVSQVMGRLSPFFICCPPPAPFSSCSEDKRALVFLKRHLNLNEQIKNSFKILKTLLSPLQVGVHVIKSMIFSQIHQHSCSTAAVSGPTEAAVTDPSAWRALPLLTKTMRNKIRLAQHTCILVFCMSFNLV